MQQLEQNPLGFLEACDVAAFVFDNSSGNSWQSFIEAEDNIPCVLIGTKEELGVSTVRPSSLRHYYACWTSEQCFPHPSIWDMLLDVLILHSSWLHC